MSQAIFYDSLSFAKELASGGFSQEQAETQARVLSRILETRILSREKHAYNLTPSKKELTP